MAIRWFCTAAPSGGDGALNHDSVWHVNYGSVDVYLMPYVQTKESPPKRAGCVLVAQAYRTEMACAMAPRTRSTSAGLLLFNATTSPPPATKRSSRRILAP